MISKKYREHSPDVEETLPLTRIPLTACIFQVIKEPPPPPPPEPVSVLFLTCHIVCSCCSAVCCPRMSLL